MELLEHQGPDKEGEVTKNLTLYLGLDSADIGELLKCFKKMGEK